MEIHKQDLLVHVASNQILRSNDLLDAQGAVGNVQCSFSVLQRVVLCYQLLLGSLTYGNLRQVNVTSGEGIDEVDVVFSVLEAGNQVVNIQSEGILQPANHLFLGLSEVLSRAHLELLDDGPNQTKNQLGIVLKNILHVNVTFYGVSIYVPSAPMPTSLTPSEARK